MTTLLTAGQQDQGVPQGTGYQCSTQQALIVGIALQLGIKIASPWSDRHSGPWETPCSCRTDFLATRALVRPLIAPMTASSDHPWIL